MRNLESDMDWFNLLNMLNWKFCNESPLDFLRFRNRLETIASCKTNINSRVWRKVKYNATLPLIEWDHDGTMIASLVSIHTADSDTGSSRNV